MAPPILLAGQTHVILPDRPAPNEQFDKFLGQYPNKVNPTNCNREN